MAELTRVERIALAQKAERLKEDVGEHLVRLGRAYQEQWARESDPVRREALWQRHAALKDLAQDIATLITDGRIAKEEEKHDDR